MKFRRAPATGVFLLRCLLVATCLGTPGYACTTSTTPVPAQSLPKDPASAAKHAEPEKTLAIVVGKRAGFQERLAARELQRYFDQLTGELPTLITDDEDPGPYRAVVLVGQETTHPRLAVLVGQGELPDATHRPGREGYVIQTLEVDRRPTIAVLGSDPSGVLYASYRLLEQYGARFYLGRDILPLQTTDFAVVDLSLHEEPSVPHRGLLPWHDFLNGPSGYSIEDFQRYINQMVKMRMNTLILHNYAGGGSGGDVTEPFMSFRCQGELHAGRLDTSVDNQRWKLARSHADDLAFGS